MPYVLSDAEYRDFQQMRKDFRNTSQSGTGTKIDPYRKTPCVFWASLDDSRYEGGQWQYKWHELKRTEDGWEDMDDGRSSTYDGDDYYWYALAADDDTDENSLLGVRYVLMKRDYLGDDKVHTFCLQHLNIKACNADTSEEADAYIEKQVKWLEFGKGFKADDAATDGEPKTKIELNIAGKNADAETDYEKYITVSEGDPCDPLAIDWNGFNVSRRDCTSGCSPLDPTDLGKFRHLRLDTGCQVGDVRWATTTDGDRIDVKGSVWTFDVKYDGDGGPVTVGQTTRIYFEDDEWFHFDLSSEANTADCGNFVTVNGKPQFTVEGCTEGGDPVSELTRLLTFDCDDFELNNGGDGDITVSLKPLTLCGLTDVDCSAPGEFYDGNPATYNAWLMRRVSDGKWIRCRSNETTVLAAVRWNDTTGTLEYRERTISGPIHASAPSAWTAFGVYKTCTT